MQEYKITLTPVEYFFFGSEKHGFDLTTSYFVESNSYPQQTTLLGLLRFYLLLKNPAIFSNNKITNPTEASKIIGTDSFNYPDNNSFGMIRSISSLYFSNGNHDYFFAPLDTGFTLDSEFYLHKNGSPFKAKDHEKDICLKLISENEKNIIKLSDIIQEVSHTGNEKGENGESKEDAFYKQIMKKFISPDWSFSFNATLEDGAGIKEETIFIPFGGEKCFFKMQIKLAHKSFKPHYPLVSHDRTFYALLCVSDCFVPSEKMNICDFAVNNFVSFRNFQSKITTRKFDSLKQNPSEIEHGQIRSNRYNLLQRGSVLYFKNKEARDNIKVLLDKTPGKEIGFNYTIINK